MGINLNDYSYSYANEIGNILKQPLYTLVANRESASLDNSARDIDEVLVQIAKAIFHHVCCLVFYIPAAVCWFVGKQICLLSNTKTSREGLVLTPPPLEAPTLSIDQPVDIYELSRKYNDFFPPAPATGGKTSKQACLRLMCEWISTGHAGIYSDNAAKRELFLQGVSQNLKGIVLELNRGDIPKDKERDILLELAEASTRCHPTWLEASTKLYAELAGKAETVEIKLLRHIQNYKEDLILRFYQNSANLQWHALSRVRIILGRELGLNLTHERLDPYARLYNSGMDRDTTKWLFKAQYKNPNRLISAIQTKILFEPYDVCYFDFLVAVSKELGATDPSDYAMTHFFDENNQINELGVNLMLKAIGVLE